MPMCCVSWFHRCGSQLNLA